MIMNYFSLIDEIKQVSLRYSEEFYEGDIYEYLNSGNHKYPCIILTVQNITTDEDVNTISATIFAVDRLTNDSSNKLEVQSLCMSKITQILGTLEERVSSIQSNTLTPFTEKFSDLCGGMYGEFTLEYIGDGVCDEGLQYKEIELTNNGIYDIIGYDKAIVNFQLEELNVTSNGEYLPTAPVKGFDKVTVELPKIKVARFPFITSCCLDENGKWNGEHKFDTSCCTGTMDSITSIKNIANVTLDLSDWDTSGCNRMTLLFSSSSGLVGVNLKGWNTSNVTSTDRSFNGTNIKSIDLTNFDFSKVTSQTGANNSFLFGAPFETCVGGLTVEQVINNNITILKGLRVSIDSIPSSLDRASLRALINGLADLTGQTTQTLTLGATLTAKLTEEDIAIAVNKNWTIA